MRPLISSLIAATFLAPLGFYFHPVYSADAIQLIKSKTSPAVYLLKDGKRKAFPTLSIYQSWFGNDFGGVAQLDPNQLAEYPLGANVIFKPGSLIKIQTDPKVYLVSDELGNLEWIQTEAAFAARGFKFSDVRDVPDTFFPDYRLPQPQSNCATPQNCTSENPGVTIPPPIIAPQPIPTPAPVQSISNVVISQRVAGAGPVADISLVTTLPGEIMLSYAGGGAATSTVNMARSASGEATKSIQVLGGGFTYTYRIDTTGPDGAFVSKVGSFVSYSDIVIESLAKNLPVNGPLALPIVTVGELRITNKSAAIAFFNQFVLVFQTASSATNAPSKTIQIVRRNANGTLGDVVAEKTVASTVSITNALNAQKIAVIDQLAPGESRDYVIMIKNLDQINLDAASPDDTFATILQRIDFNSEVSVSVPTEALGRLQYRKN